MNTRKSITGSGQETDAILIQGGMINASVWGSFTGTVKLEKSTDDLLKESPAVWLEIAEFTAPEEFTAEDAENSYYKIRCTAHTLGTIEVRLGGK